MQRNKNSHGSILSKITGLVMLPLFILTVTLCAYSIYCIYGFSRYSNKETLGISAKSAIYAIKVSDVNITGDMSSDEMMRLNALLKELKNTTGHDYSLYVGEQKFATTSPGQELDYTKAEVLSEGDIFYNNVPCNGQSCCVYIKNFEYLSLPCRVEVVNINNDSFSAFSGKVLKVTMLIIFLFIPVLLLVFMFLHRLNKSIREIRNYSNAVAIEEFDVMFSDDILNRNDELQGIAQDMTKMKSRLQCVIEKDLLTKIYNRRAGEKRLSKYKDDYNSKGVPFSFAIGDIDFFKKVNDNYGHEAGDEVLKRIASIIDKNMKKYGFAARWGGEEFMLVFKGIHDTEAAHLLEGILTEIRVTSIQYHGILLGVTMTFGVVEYKGEDLERTFRRADHKLYVGKERGRNRVVLNTRNR